MKVEENEYVVMCDVDETLVMHQPESTIPAGERLEVYDHVSKGFIVVRVNKPMVRLVREEAYRGAAVYVWSKSGYKWAASAVKALDLVDCVTRVMSKPVSYLDDKPVESFMSYRVWISPDKTYKQTKTNN